MIAAEYRLLHRMLAVLEIVNVQKTALALLLTPIPIDQYLGQDLVGIYTCTGDVYGAALRMGGLRACGSPLT